LEAAIAEAIKRSGSDCASFIGVVVRRGKLKIKVANELGNQGREIREIRPKKAVDVLAAVVD
jgi:hypothetical protein